MTGLQAAVLRAVRDRGPVSRAVERAVRETEGVDFETFAGAWDAVRARRWVVSEFLHARLTDAGKRALQAADRAV